MHRYGRPGWSMHESSLLSKTDFIWNVIQRWNGNMPEIVRFRYVNDNKYVDT